jgi:hypothetical protein
VAQLHRRRSEEKSNFRRHLIGAVPGVALLAMAFTQAQAAERRPERAVPIQAGKIAKAPAATPVRTAQASSYTPSVRAPVTEQTSAHRILEAQIRALS